MAGGFFARKAVSPLIRLLPQEKEVSDLFDSLCLSARASTAGPILILNISEQLIICASDKTSHIMIVSPDPDSLSEETAKAICDRLTQSLDVEAEVADCSAEDVRVRGWAMFEHGYNPLPDRAREGLRNLAISNGLQIIETDSFNPQKNGQSSVMGIRLPEEAVIRPSGQPPEDRMASTIVAPSSSDAKAPIVSDVKPWTLNLSTEASDKIEVSDKPDPSIRNQGYNEGDADHDVGATSMMGYRRTRPPVNPPQHPTSDEQAPLRIEADNEHNQKEIQVGLIQHVPATSRDVMRRNLRAVRNTIMECAHEHPLCLHSKGASIDLSADVALEVGGILPAILLHAFIIWTPIAFVRPESGFSMRLETDPTAWLGYRLVSLNCASVMYLTLAVSDAIGACADQEEVHGRDKAGSGLYEVRDGKLSANLIKSIDISRAWLAAHHHKTTSIDTLFG